MNIDKLNSIHKTAADAWFHLFVLENDMPDACEGLEEGFEEDFEMVQQAVADIGDLMDKLRNAMAAIEGVAPKVERPTHRVIQGQETGEERNVFEGSEDECYDWMDDNAEQFVESIFWVEVIE